MTRAFLGSYLDQMIKYGIYIPADKVSWKTALQRVTKPESNSKCRSTADLRPVDAATKAEAWSLPIWNRKYSIFRVASTSKL